MSSPEGTSPQAQPRRRGTWIRRSAIALLALALVAVGAAGGQFLWPRQVVVQQFDANEGTAATAIMPHVLGLSEDDARAAIADAGYGHTLVTVQRAAAGDPGSVLEQKPAAQAEVGPDTAVELVISTPTPMPSLVGKDQQSAQEEVEKLGGAAQIVAVVDATHPPGTVLSTEPQTGKTMPQIVQLRVATGGTARLLTELTPVQSDGCSRGTDLQVDGRAFATALICTPRDGSPARAIYSLSRKAGYLRFTLGVPDRTDDTRATAEITVLVDDKVALKRRAKFGTSTQHAVPLADALRMEIRVAAGSSSSRPEVALGDIALMGLASDLDQLQ